MNGIYKYFKKSVSETLHHALKKLTPRTKKPKLSPPPKQYQAGDIKAFRKKLHYSQHFLAAVLNVSMETIQDWEAGIGKPSASANRILERLDSEITSQRLFDDLTA